MDHSRFRVHGCDLFLLEHWDADSTLSADDQLLAIFNRFLSLSFNEHKKYVLRAKNRPDRSAATLPPEDAALLARVRPAQERLASYEDIYQDIYLRTYYGPGSDEALASLLPELKFTTEDKELMLFDDPVRYASEDGDWQAVLFDRMPQLLEGGPGIACAEAVGFEYEDCRWFHLGEGRHYAKGPRRVVEEDEGLWPNSALDFAYFFSEFYRVSQLGHVYVLDECTLGYVDPEDAPYAAKLAAWQQARAGMTQEDLAREWTERQEAEARDWTVELLPLPWDPPEKESGRLIMTAWYDAYGGTVRYDRRTPSAVQVMAGELSKCGSDEPPGWMEAGYGNGYEPEELVVVSEDESEEEDNDAMDVEGD